MRPHRAETRVAAGGYVLGLVAIIIIPLVAAVALATDVGAWYAEATSVQRAADAAALAGVVWMPDETKATQVAIEVAARNGYDADDPAIDVAVAPVAGSAEQLRVVIEDRDPPVFFSGAFLEAFSISRQAVAEYVLPVPLGSPKNHLGTGDLLPGSRSEGFWLSLNGFCTPVEQGGLKGPRFAGNNGGPDGVVCPTGADPPAGPGPDTYTDGTDYHEDNEHHDGTHTYEFYVEHRDNSENTDILLFDPTMNDTGPDRRWEADASITSTFAIRSPDATPLSDSDNPSYDGCTNLGGRSTVTFATGDTAGFDRSALGSDRWTLFCTVPADAPTGRYIVSVTPQVAEARSNGANNFAILARRASLGDVCDGRAHARCPRVYAKEWMSIQARARSPQADFFLAEVGDAHEGKILRVILFDPGEGGNRISLLDPSGTAVAFEWSTFDGRDAGAGSFVDVSGTRTDQPPRRQSNSRYNERFVEILVSLPDDFSTAYPAGDRWWKVSYDYDTAPTDRTTWSASIVGDPVRLVA